MTFDIVVSELSLKYGEFYALKNVSFQLQEGKIYGLLGRNGAGKTSLLSLLASYREPTEGTIQIGGETPFENEKVVQHVVFMHEKDYSDESDTVKGLLEFYERYRPYYDRDYAIHLLNQFNISLNKKVKALSKGKQAALNAAIGLACRAPITIFDETYLGMDAPTREIFYKELLEDHAKHPRTVILSTHLVSEMDYLFHEVLIIDQGALLYHEDYDTFVSRGVSITGAANHVDAFVAGMNVIAEKQLGNTKQVMVFESLSEQFQKEAVQNGLEIGSISLQDLFIHLTGEAERKR